MEQQEIGFPMIRNGFQNFMIEKQMIRLMLNKKFYTQYKGILSPTVFAGDISSLYDTIQKAHEKYEQDIKVDELYSWVGIIV